MTLQHIRWGLWLLTAGCGTGILLSLSSAFFFPPPFADPQIAPLPEPTPRATDQTEFGPSLNLEQILAFSHKRLQRPFRDPPPPMPKPPKPTLNVSPPRRVKLPPNVRLIGTLAESETAYALLRVGDKSELKRAGEVLEGQPGVRLIAIHRDTVTVEFQQVEFELSVPMATSLSQPRPS